MLGPQTCAVLDWPGLGFPAFLALPILSLMWTVRSASRGVTMTALLKGHWQKKTNVHRKWSVTFICVGQLVARCLVECSAADTKQAGSIYVHIVLIVHESFNAVLSPTDPINDSLETMVSLF